MLGPILLLLLGCPSKDPGALALDADLAAPLAIQTAPSQPADVNYVERDGLRIGDVAVGPGAEATATSQVSFHYTAWLADGTRFDSSMERGTPLEAPLGKGVLIPGMERALVGMRAGGVRQVVIPPELGYGDRAIGPIPAGSTLTFQLLLLTVSAPRIVPTAPPEATSWRTTSSGLKIADISGCDAPNTPPGSTLLLDYTLWLPDGRVVDSSLARSEPLRVEIGKGMVIAGWDEGLRAAPVGCRRLLEVPPALGYGERSAGPIPPNSTLLFEVEVVGAETPRIAAPPPPKKAKKGEEQGQGGY